MSQTLRGMIVVSHRRDDRLLPRELWLLCYFEAQTVSLVYDSNLNIELLYRVLKTACSTSKVFETEGCSIRLTKQDRNFPHIFGLPADPLVVLDILFELTSNLHGLLS